MGLKFFYFQVKLKCKSALCLNEKIIGNKTLKEIFQCDLTLWDKIYLGLFDNFPQTIL